MIEQNDPRYLALLQTIADTSQDQPERLAALEELVEEWLPESHPFRSEPLWVLYERLKFDWEERPYRVEGHTYWKRVSRPPVALCDVL